MKKVYALAALSTVFLMGTAVNAQVSVDSSSSSSSSEASNNAINHKKKIAGLLALSKQHIADKNYGSAKKTLEKLHENHGYTQEFKSEKHHYDEQMAAINSKE